MFVKAIKWGLLVILGFVAAVILSLEIFYHYAVHKLELVEIQVERYAPEVAYQELWAVNNEEGEVGLVKLSATELVFDLLTSASSSEPQTKRFKGLQTANHASRLLTLNEGQFTFSRQGHMDRAVATIWLTRNATITDIQAYILENTYFGNQAYGLASASQVYFDKKVSDLTDDEMVSLVKLLK